VTLPEDMTSIRGAAMRAIAPIRAADNLTKADRQFLFTAQRTDAGRELPPYYLVYFLLVDLLGFKNLGRFEKVAWSVPIDYEGEAFLIEHRKFGVGVFARDAATQEPQAQEIVNLVKKAIRVAEPFFDSLALQAMTASKLNVINRTDDLYERFEFFLTEYRRTAREGFDGSGERQRQTRDVQNEPLTLLFPAFSLHQQAGWHASTAIDAFFSWTEHVFIHIAILLGRITSAVEVAELAADDWTTKFKRALDINDPDTKAFYDDLIEIRRQHRNFVTHGSFGKRGEAFSFHSGAGAVPVLLPHRNGSRRFALADRTAIADPAAVKVILAFIDHLWSGARAPARLYLQRSSLPIILTMAADGTYSRAMASLEDMQELVDRLVWEWDRAANMDW
jgi:hypothetical protein